MYYEGLNFANISLGSLTTDKIDIMPDFWGKLSSNGWEKYQPCNISIVTYGSVPEVRFGKDFGVHIDNRLALVLNCRKKNTD